MAERDPAVAMRANLATMIALFGLLAIAAGLLGLMALVLPHLLGIVVVVFTLFAGPIALHYLVWGWWLSQLKDENPDDDESRSGVLAASNATADERGKNCN